MGEEKRKDEAKRKAFEEDPDRFVDLQDILVAAIKKSGPNGEQGVGYLINSGINHMALKAVGFEIPRQINIFFDKDMLMKEAERAKSGIITPNGGNGRFR